MDKFKITTSEINENNVKSAQDILRGTPRENKNIFDKLPELIAQRHNELVEYIPTNFYNKQETEIAISNRVNDIGSSDMTKAVYDKNNNSIVDNAERLGGQLPEYYATKEDLDVKVVTQVDTDLNNYTTFGTFFFEDSYTPLNVPDSVVNGWLIVLPSKENNAVKQICLRKGTADSNNYMTYIRTFLSGKWSSWTMVMTDKGGVFTAPVKVPENINAGDYNLKNINIRTKEDSDPQFNVKGITMWLK